MINSDLADRLSFNGFSVQPCYDWNTWYDTSKYTIGMGIPYDENGAHTGLLHFQIGWIVLQIKITPANTIFVRARYGDNGWNEWRDM